MLLKPLLITLGQLHSLVAVMGEVAGKTLDVTPSAVPEGTRVREIVWPWSTAILSQRVCGTSVCDAGAPCGAIRARRRCQGAALQ
jgi:hypothetical protein